MLIAKRTAYRRFDGDGGIRYGSRTRKRKWDWFICGDSLWDTFPLSGPPPETIRIELHDTPATDRVAIANSPGKFDVYCDGVAHYLFIGGYEWLLPHLEKYGTVYAEVWY